MEQSNRELADSVDISGLNVESLIREHRMLDDKVTELVEQSYLSPDQNLELTRLKKEKLRLKDRIAHISFREESA